MQEFGIKEGKTRLLSVVVLLASIAAFAFTGFYLLLAIPLVYLFFLLAGANWKTIYWIFLFTIPVSVHISFLGGTLSTSVPDEPIMWFFLLMFGLMWANNPQIIPEWWFRHPLVLLVTLQYVWLLVTVVFSTEPLFSVKFFLAKTWFLVSFFLLPVFVFREKKDYKKALLLFLVPLVATMIFIFIRHRAMGFNFRKVERAIGMLYYNHVEYSTVMSMVFPVICMAFPLTRNKPLWIRGALLLVILFFLPAVYLTYARAAYLAIIFAFGIYLAIRLRLVNLVMPVFYGLISLLLVYMIQDNKYISFRPNLHQTYMHKTWTDHVVATFRGEDMSSMERLYRWIAGIRMSMDRPLTGYGPNSFYENYKPYAVSAFRTYVSRNPEKSTTHNYFLLMLVEQGWPGMILYAILVMMVFAQGQKTYYRFKDRFYKKATLAVVMMFAAGFINNFFSELLETHKVGALFYLSIALLVILDRKSKQLAAENQEQV
jgi:O-antigen ligase